MTDQQVKIQKAKPKDCDPLLQMMLNLARFEGYAEQFAVTGTELNRRLFQQKDFEVFIAKAGETAVGMLVYYYLPFSYDLRPWVYIKELFVEPEFRSKSIGKMLMTALAKECFAKGCTRIRWDVLSSNDLAKNFYKSLGAIQDKNWCLFSMDENNILTLAAI